MKNSNKTKGYASKILWIIISLLCSFVMWVYISNPESNDYKQTFRGVQVVFEGEEKLLEERNISIINVDNQSVTVTLKGSRNKIAQLNTSDITAVIDVSSIKQPNAMSWAYSLRFPDNFDSSDVTVIAKTPETISFTVVKNATKTITVKGSFEGEIAEGCVAEEYIFEPSTIVVEGPEDKIEKIENAWLTFGTGTIDSTYSEEVGFALVDAEGQAISTTGLKLSANSVTATQPILKTKDIPLTVNLIAGGGVSAEDCTVTIEPNTVKIAGDSKQIDSINSIVLGSVDLASFLTSYTTIMPLKLEDDIQNLTGVNDAAVLVEIKGAHTKSFTTDNISCRNVTDGYTAQIDTKVLELMLRSKDETVLDSIRPDNISVVVDLTDYNTTTGQVIAMGQVFISGFENVGAVGDVRVSVTLSKD